MLEIPLEKQSSIPLYLQISEHLERMILNGAIQEGTRLPSSREFACSLSVSRTTVIEAYRHLEDEGFLLQKGRSGAYVCWKSSDGDRRPDTVKVRWDLASGDPSPDLIPFCTLSRISRELLQGMKPETLVLSDPEGVPELRKELVSHAVSRGIPARWDDVFVTSGGREGLSLSMAAIQSSGIKKLWMEELTYPDAVIIARSHGLELGVIPMEMEKLARLTDQLGPSDALYLVPSFQNPTGRILPSEIRRIILDTSIKRGFWILEDDAYGELRYGETAVPALKSMVGADKVIYLGSFSQALFPGLRLGYSLLPLSIRQAWKRHQTQGAGPVSSLVQFLIMKFIEEGCLEESLTIARLTIASRMKALAAALNKYLPGSDFSVPEGGIYLWLKIPGLDGDRAEDLALSRGISVVSGNQFSWIGKPQEAVRLTVSSVESCSMERVARELCNVWFP